MRQANSSDFDIGVFSSRRAGDASPRSLHWAVSRASRRPLVARPQCHPRPLLARKGLVVRPVEEILGGVRHSRHLAWEVPGIGGGVPAPGVTRLVEGTLVKIPLALVVYLA